MRPPLQPYRSAGQGHPVPDRFCPPLPVPSGRVTARQIGRDAARLFLVRRHLLAPPRSLPAGRESVMTVFGRLGSIQFDPLEFTGGRNHDLVLAARIADYRREMTDALLYEERRLFEAYNKGLSLLPTAELPWYRLTWDRNQERHGADTFQKHAGLVDEVLGRIRREGPLSTLDFETRASIDWYWRPTNQVRAIMEALGQSGVLGFARRQGNRRYYDLVERLFPADLLAQRPDPQEQRLHRLLSRYRAHGLLGRTGQAELWIGSAPSQRTGWYEGPLRGELLATLLERGELVPVTVDGVRGERFLLRGDVALLDEAEHDADAAAARPRTDPWAPLDGDHAGVALLAPLDPFVWDREFLRALFDFDYLWEVYVPEKKRRWGYYVLPVLWGDRLVGRIEPRIDRADDAIRVVSVYWEPGFDPSTPAFSAALAHAIEAHRRFAGVGRVLLARTAGVAALRPILGEHLAALGRPARKVRSAMTPRRPTRASIAPAAPSRAVVGR